jgi:hypothetical protein
MANELTLIATQQGRSTVIIATPVGPRGPKGDSGGFEVIDGILEITGSTGISSVEAQEGYVTIALDLTEEGIGDPYSALSHNAYTTLSSDNGNARKVAFLNEDGSIGFDFIRNYDVFKPSDFEFSIVSFTIPGLSPQLVGFPGNSILLQSYAANMSYIQTPTSATIKLLNSPASTGTGFPITVPAPFTGYTFIAGQTLVYKAISYAGSGTNNDYYNLQLEATGIGFDGNPVTVTRNTQVYLYNHKYYGISTTPNLTSVSEFSTTSLTGTRAATVTVNATGSNYIYYAYPSRLGEASFTDTATGLNVGVVDLGTHSVINANGYIENYRFFRTNQAGLGQLTIAIT